MRCRTFEWFFRNSFVGMRSGCDSSRSYFINETPALGDSRSFPSEFSMDVAKKSPGSKVITFFGLMVIHVAGLLIE